MPGPDQTVSELHPKEALLDQLRLARELRIRAARREVTEQRRLAQRVRQALAQDGFLFHYHPAVHLKSGKIRGAEAVIRLRHKRRGLVMPNHFMAIAGRSELINEIGNWIITRSCKDATGWPDSYNVCIRLAHRQLRGGALIKQIIEVLCQTGLPAARLQLGITEAMLVDRDNETKFCLQALIALGVTLALDDFGTGYASLSALKLVPFHCLKLDRSMVQALGESHGDNSVVHAAIEAGHAMGCIVQACGVETLLQCRLLAELGCDDAQGPYFGPPLKDCELLARLA